MNREQIEDELRAAAWKLAALTSRNEAQRILKKLADQISDAQWRHS